MSPSSQAQTRQAKQSQACLSALHRAWWQLVNFTYDDRKAQIEAYVFRIQKAEVWDIFPILAPGTIHQDVVVRPIGHNVWTKYSNNTGKWQTISTEACIPKEQQGYDCKNVVIENKDVCLNTEDRTSTFEMLPSGHAQPQVYYVGKGCACIRTSCASVSSILVKKKQTELTYVFVILPKYKVVILAILFR